MRAHALEAERIHADDTTVPVVVRVRPGRARFDLAVFFE
jgi:hypothetical protein